MLTLISIVIPVGPYPSNVKWLADALDSIKLQTVAPTEVLLINDGMINLSMYQERGLRVWTPPWHSGVAHSFNFGVALAPTELVLMMGSDDLLRPLCLEACLNSYLSNDERDAYYWLDVEYMSTKHVQSVPCNAACVTKGLWKLTGGIPREGACGAGDAALLSIMMANNLPIHRVNTDPDNPQYVYRDHEDTDTMQRREWHSLIVDIRGLLTSSWKPLQLSC